MALLYERNITCAGSALLTHPHYIFFHPPGSPAGLSPSPAPAKGTLRAAAAGTPSKSLDPEAFHRLQQQQLGASGAQAGSGWPQQHKGVSAPGASEEPAASSGRPQHKGVSAPGALGSMTAGDGRSSSPPPVMQQGLYDEATFGPLVSLGRMGRGDVRCVVPKIAVLTCPNT